MSLKPMIRGTYADEPDNFRRCLELGFTFFQTDSDHLSTNETAPGIWDWAAFDAKLKQVKDAGAHWIFFPHFAFPPPWYRTAHLPGQHGAGETCRTGRRQGALDARRVHGFSRERMRTHWGQPFTIHFTSGE